MSTAAKLRVQLETALAGRIPRSLTSKLINSGSLSYVDSMK